jgi:hypothetical protein
MLSGDHIRLRDLFRATHAASRIALVAICAIRNTTNNTSRRDLFWKTAESISLPLLVKPRIFDATIENNIFSNIWHFYEIRFHKGDHSGKEKLQSARPFHYW